MRLGDLDEAKKIAQEFPSDPYHVITACAVIDKTPTIDPEMLPIVRQLREELEKVTAERDAAVKNVKDLVLGEIKACSYCKHNDPENFDCMTEGFGYCGNWEWRDPQKEE